MRAARPGKAMQHMNSVRVPATVIFSALLVVIMISASRTTYKFTTEREASALGPSCTLPVELPGLAHDPDPARACPWPQAPRAFSQKWPRKVHAWPDSRSSGAADFATPGEAPRPNDMADDMPAHTLRAEDRGLRTPP